MRSRVCGHKKTKKGVRSFQSSDEIFVSKSLDQSTILLRQNPKWLSGRASAPFAPCSDWVYRSAMIIQRWFSFIDIVLKPEPVWGSIETLTRDQRQETFSFATRSPLIISTRHMHPYDHSKVEMCLHWMGAFTLSIIRIIIAINCWGGWRLGAHMPTREITLEPPQTLGRGVPGWQEILEHVFNWLFQPISFVQRLRHFITLQMFYFQSFVSRHKCESHRIQLLSTTLSLLAYVMC